MIRTQPTMDETVKVAIGGGFWDCLLASPFVRHFKVVEGYRRVLCAMPKRAAERVISVRYGAPSARVSHRHQRVSDGLAWGRALGHSALLSAGRAPGGEKTPLGAVYGRPQQKAGEKCGLGHPDNLRPSVCPPCADTSRRKACKRSVCLEEVTPGSVVEAVFSIAARRAPETLRG